MCVLHRPSVFESSTTRHYIDSFGGGRGEKRDEQVSNLDAKPNLNQVPFPKELSRHAKSLWSQFSSLFSVLEWKFTRIRRENMLFVSC